MTKTLGTHRQNMFAVKRRLVITSLATGINMVNYLLDQFSTKDNMYFWRDRRQTFIYQLSCCFRQATWSIQQFTRERRKCSISVVYLFSSPDSLYFGWRGTSCSHALTQVIYLPFSPFWRNVSNEFIAILSVGQHPTFFHSCITLNGFNEDILGWDNC